MKEEALALVQAVAGSADKQNLLREYVQESVLRSLHESEAFLCLSFVGGTALRFLHGLPRFSEDLDFSLENSEGYEPVRWLAKLKRDMSLAGFDLTLKWNDRKVVHTAWIRIGELLKDAGLAALPEQKLSVKLEIDTNPPAGAVFRSDVVSRHVAFVIRHHDLPSLMAGKLHALMTRSYVKGRDWYDFLWYRARRPPVEPNLTQLQNALDQTEGKGAYDSKQWTRHIADKLEELDLESVKHDVLPFLERPREAELLTREHLLSLVR